MLNVDVDKPEVGFRSGLCRYKGTSVSFTRLQKADPVLGVDMASTGEVGAIGAHFDDALLHLCFRLLSHPKKTLWFRQEGQSRMDLLDACRLLKKNGYNLFATGGTQKFWKRTELSTFVAWPDDQDASLELMI